MKTAGLLLLLFISPLVLCSQVVIKGMLKAKTDVDLFSSNIIVFADKEQKSFITYGITDTEGKFKIEINSKVDSIFLQVKSLTVADTVLKLANKSQVIQIDVTARKNQIDEVIIKKRPIRSNGDTTTYIVTSFAQKNDESIGDVIKKMPGFDVNINGQISYNGQMINKYYIEGLDLLEGRYALANKNIPYSDVGTVEVLHNHNPIKILEKTTSSNSTSINIKLKNKITYTGRCRVGLGFSPLLGELNLSPMLFSKKQQIILSLQFNNIGEDLQTQHQTLIFRSGSIRGLTTFKEEYVYPQFINKPDISQNKYFNNNAKLFSYNHLFKLTPNTEVKFNGSFFSDRTSEEQVSSTQYFTGNQTLLLNEKQTNRQYRNSFIFNASINNNSKSVYIDNKISYAQFWDSDKAILIGETYQQSDIKTPHQTFSNELDIAIPIRKTTVKISSIIDYNKSPQEISFSPISLPIITGNYQTITQQISNSNISSKNDINWTFPIMKRVLLTTTIALSNQRNKHKTNILADDNTIELDSLQNSIQWDINELMVREEIEYSTDPLKIKISIPLNYEKINLIDRIHTLGNTKNNLFFSPTASIKLTPIGGLSIYGSAGYKEDYTNPRKQLMGNVITSFRTISSSHEQIDVNKSFSYNTGSNYRNINLGLFISANFTRKVTDRNFIVNQIHTGNGQFHYTSLNKPNTVTTNSFNSEITWYINSIRSTIGVKYSKSKNKSNYLLNEQVNTLETTNETIQPSVMTNFSKWGSLDYSFSHIASKSEYYYNLYKSYRYKHYFNILFYLFEDHIISCSTELYRCFSWNKTTSNSIFSDISYSFKPKKTQMKFELKIKNIFNTKSYVNFMESEFMILNSEYFLRPREILFTISFSLKKRN